MTINGPAAIMLAFFVVAADAQDAAPDQLAGTIQADILKEYIAQKEWCFPIDAGVRLQGDMIEWCTRQMPRWHPVSISGYHIREAGATAAQELAFTLKNGLTYVEEQIARGLDIDSFAPRLSFFFNAQIDFFEEIAKYRAARRIWARELRENYGARNPRSWLMRFHAQTAGVSLTAQQPLNNITRTAIEALAGVLGGTQSLHTNSYDEALALPTEEAVQIALRTQQIIAHETGVTNTIDPLGGSYFVEALTDEIEAKAYRYFAEIDRLGGMVEAVKRNYPQREIADAAFELQRRIDSGERVVVGVNSYTIEDEPQIPTMRIDPSLEGKQIDRLAAVRARRDGSAVEASLVALRSAAATPRNLMEPLLDAARAHATEGEIVQASRTCGAVSPKRRCSSSPRQRGAALFGRCPRRRPRPCWRRRSAGPAGRGCGRRRPPDRRARSRRGRRARRPSCRDRRTPGSTHAWRQRSAPASERYWPPAQPQP